MEIEVWVMRSNRERLGLILELELILGLALGTLDGFQASVCDGGCGLDLG